MRIGYTSTGPLEMESMAGMYWLGNKSDYIKLYSLFLQLMSGEETYILFSDQEFITKMYDIDTLKKVDVKITISNDIIFCKNISNIINISLPRKIMSVWMINNFHSIILKIIQQHDWSGGFYYIDFDPAEILDYVYQVFPDYNAKEIYNLVDQYADGIIIMKMVPDSFLAGDNW